jgi:hypothetical protein
MTREVALVIVKELEDRFNCDPIPGQSDGAIEFFTSKANQLKWAIDFNLETSSMLDWANRFYSARKWERWGDSAIRTHMYQAIDRVRRRIEGAPDRVFS